MAVSAPELPVSKPLEAPLTHRLARRATEYARLMRLDRPVGTWLLLWPALWALWIAGDGPPEPLVLIVFVLGVFVMRAAGCVINDFADRDIDPHVRRTRDRPLAARRVSPTEALVLFVALGLIALYLVTRLDPFTIKLAVHRRAAHRLLSVPQALLPAAAAVPRDLLRRLERAHGLCGAGRRAAARRLGAVHRRGDVGRDLRHHLRHGRPRGRPARSA